MMLRLLECALALEKYGTYALAADRIGVSQPTLTRNIQELERQFDVRLFDRTRRGVVPTEFGRVLLESARRIEGNIKDLKREIDLLQGLGGGQLDIGIGPVVAQAWMPEAVAALLRKNPKLNLRILSHDWWDLVTALRDRRVDMGVGELESIADEAEIEVIPLPARPMRFYARPDHPLARKPDLVLSDLGGFPLLCPKVPRRAGELFAAAKLMGRSAENGRFEPQIECQTLDSCMRIVANSDAIGIGAVTMLDAHVRTREFMILDFHAPWLTTNYGIVHLRERSMSPAAKAFCEQVTVAERESFERSELAMSLMRGK